MPTAYLSELYKLSPSFKFELSIFCLWLDFAPTHGTIARSALHSTVPFAIAPYRMSLKCVIGVIRYAPSLSFIYFVSPALSLLDQSRVRPVVWHLYRACATTTPACCFTPRSNLLVCPSRNDKDVDASLRPVRTQTEDDTRHTHTHVMIWFTLWCWSGAIHW